MPPFEILPNTTGRQTDVELLELRLDIVKNEVLPQAVTEAAVLNNWQQEALTALVIGLQTDQTIDLPTRSGKSFLLRKIAKAAQEKGVRTAIVTHRRHILSEHAEELAAEGVVTQDIGLPAGQQPGVVLLSAQTIAMNRSVGEVLDDSVDLVLIDEAHRALGQKTVEGMREVFPNAVRIALTATPDYAADRSVVDEYGSKLTSHSVVEAIEHGRVSAVRAFLYKTDAVIEDLDPNIQDFTPRELRRLANLVARNQAIADTAQDLVAAGRQGLITTIPGEDLLHADILKKLLESRNVKDSHGETRRIRAHVVRGGDQDLAERLEDFEDGAIDVLLYCDLLREGYGTDIASFLINGRPTTSIVNLTQDIGRVLQPKHIEAVIVDFLDVSVKEQRTVYDVLELDRSVQGVYVGQPSSPGEPETTGNDSYMRGLFRPEVVRKLSKYNNRLLAELRYSPVLVKSPFEKKREKFERERATELATQTKIWEKLLAKEGLTPEVGDDLFGASPSFIAQSRKVTKNSDNTYVLDILPNPSRTTFTDESWIGFEHRHVVLPPLSLPPEEITVVSDERLVTALPVDPAEIVAHSLSDLRQNLARLIAKLDERSQQLLIERFGLHSSGMPKTLDETGLVFDITRERIRQLESRALSVLRQQERTAYKPRLHNPSEPGTYHEMPNEEDLTPRTVADWLPIVQAPRTYSAEHIARNKALMPVRDEYFKTLTRFIESKDHIETISMLIRELSATHGRDKWDFEYQQRVFLKLVEADPNAPLRTIRIFNVEQEAHLKQHRSSMWWARQRNARIAAIYKATRDIRITLQKANAHTDKLPQP